MPSPQMARCQLPGQKQELAGLVFSQGTNHPTVGQSSRGKVNLGPWRQHEWLLSCEPKGLPGEAHEALPVLTATCTAF